MYTALRESSATNDRNILLPSYRPPIVFQIIIQWMFVHIKGFERYVPRKSEKRRTDQTEAKLKVHVCCFSQLYSWLQTLFTQFIGSAVGDWWWGCLEANTDSFQKLQACILVNFVLGRMEHHLDKHRDSRTPKVFFVLFCFVCLFFFPLTDAVLWKCLPPLDFFLFLLICHI